MRFIWSIFIILILVSYPVSADFPAEGTYISLRSGSSESYSKFDGQTMLIEAFATWCVPCKAEMHELNRINNEYGTGGTNNLTILSLSVSPSTDSTEKVTAFKLDAEKEYGFTADWEFGIASLPADHKSSFASQLGVDLIPTTLLIKATGEVEQKWEGVVTAEQISEYIDANVTFAKSDPTSPLITQIVDNTFFRVFTVLILMMILYKLLIPTETGKN